MAVERALLRRRCWEAAFENDVALRVVESSQGWFRWNLLSVKCDLREISGVVRLGLHCRCLAAVVMDVLAARCRSALGAVQAGAILMGTSAVVCS